MANLNIAVVLSGVDSGASSMVASLTQGLGGLADITGGAVAFALGGLLTDGIEAATRALGEFLTNALNVEGQQASLAAVLKSTGDVSGLTAGMVNDLAGQFRDLAGGSKEAIVNIEEIGIRSGAISAQQMPDFIKDVADLGAVMGDTSTAATLLARAQEDPVGALGKLQRAGILFSESQKEQIKQMTKAGDTAGATALIMQRVAEATGGAAAANADTMAGRWEILKNNLLDAGTNVVEKLLPGLETLFDVYIKPNIPVIEEMASRFADNLGPAMGSVIAIVKNIIDAIAKLQKDGLGALGPMIGGLWTQIQPPLNAFIANVFNWVRAQLPVWIAQLQVWGQAFVTWIAPMIPPLIAEAQKLAGQLLAWLAAQIPPLLAQLAAWGRELWAWVAPMIPPLIAEAEKLGGQLMDWLGAQIPPLVAQLLRWGQEFVNWVGPQIPPLLAEVGKLLGQLSAWLWGTALPEIITQIAKWAVAFADWVMKPGGAKDQILPALGSFLLAVGKFVDTDLIPGFVGFAKSFIDGLLDGFNTNLPTLVTNVTDMGKAIIGGIVAGIQAAPGAVLGALSSIVDGAIEAIKHRLGIASPSTVFAEMGQNMMAGLAQGITASMQMPQLALNSSMNGLVSSGGAGGAAVGPGGGNTTNITYNVTGQYAYQNERTLAQDLALMTRLRPST